MQTKKPIDKFKTISNKELLDELFKRLKEVNCYELAINQYTHDFGDIYYSIYNMDTEKVEFSVELKDDKLSWS
jgi:hypothetical protein